MKSVYSDVTRFLSVLVLASAWEVTALSRLLARTFAAPLEGEAAIREQLAAAIYLLDRQGEELAGRVKEQFGMPVDPPARLRELWEDAASPDLTAGLFAVRQSVAARVQLCQRESQSLDAHTRFLLRLHRCHAEGVLLPVLDEVLAALGGAEGGEQLCARAFEEAYRQALPKPRSHPDDFLLPLTALSPRA